MNKGIIVDGRKPAFASVSGYTDMLIWATEFLNMEYMEAYYSIAEVQAEYVAISFNG